MNSSTQNNLSEAKTQITKLNNRNGSRVSSASTSVSNSIFPNLTPEATHITTQSQLNNFKWLKAIKAITKEEFEAKHAELKKIYFHSDLNIGFTK